MTKSEAAIHIQDTEKFIHNVQKSASKQVKKLYPKKTIDKLQEVLDKSKSYYRKGEYNKIAQLDKRETEKVLKSL